VELHRDEAGPTSLLQPPLLPPFVDKIGVDPVGTRDRCNGGYRRLALGQHFTLELRAMAPPAFLSLFHGVHLPVWWTPPFTPHTIFARGLSRALTFFSPHGIFVAGSTSEQFKAQVEAEVTKWGRIIKTAGLVAE
jgi:hypothetical protein